MLSRDLARRLSESIREGKVAVGDFLPPARALAAQYRVSLGTVQVALRELETQKLIECIPRKGAVVRAAEAGAPAAEQAGLAASASPAEAVRQIAVLGASEADRSDADVWTARILRAAEETLFEAGYSMVMLPAHHTVPDWWRRLCDRLDRFQGEIAAAISFALPGIDQVLAELDRRGLRTVTLGRPGWQAEHNYVAAQNLVGARQAGRCFARLGYRRVVILSSDVNCHVSTMEKVIGFYRGFLEAGAPTNGISVLTCAGLTEMTGYMAMKSWLATAGEAPQGVFTEGDLLALGAIHALVEAGISVPDQAGVVGCTGLHIAETASPSLSVVAQPMEQMGRELGLMLRELIERDVARIPGRAVPTELTLRQSVRVPEELRDVIASELRQS